MIQDAHVARQARLSPFDTSAVHAELATNYYRYDRQSMQHVCICCHGKRGLRLGTTTVDLLRVSHWKILTLVVAFAAPRAIAPGQLGGGRCRCQQEKRRSGCWLEEVYQEGGALGIKGRGTDSTDVGPQCSRPNSCSKAVPARIYVHYFQELSGVLYVMR